MLECIKRNFRIFIREEYKNKLLNYCEELKDNIVAPKTQCLVIDTSYFVYMFEEKIGLNILFDPNIKKIFLLGNAFTILTALAEVTQTSEYIFNSAVELI